MPKTCKQYYFNKLMSCLVLKSFLFSTPYFLCLKFAGNVVVLMLRFHAYVVSVYKTDKVSYRDHVTLVALIVVKQLVHVPAVHLSRY